MHDNDLGWTGILGGLALGSTIIVGFLNILAGGYDRDVWKDHRRPEPVSSAGGSLVERQVRDGLLTARRRIEVFVEPQRELLFPMFWRRGAPAGHVEKGEIVRVLGVKETYLWRDRVVWLEVERTTDAEETKSVWQLVGHQLYASSSVRSHWRTTGTDGPTRNQ